MGIERVPSDGWSGIAKRTLSMAREIWRASTSTLMKLGSVDTAGDANAAMSHITTETKAAADIACDLGALFMTRTSGASVTDAENVSEAAMKALDLTAQLAAKLRRIQPPGGISSA